jgi:fatty-acyl-CoA synthase
VDRHRDPESWSYSALLARITQTANLFHRLGATKDTVIALALPNLPETHFAIWGAEAAGIVLPLNPLLEAAALAALLDASGAEILVTLAPHPGTDLWTRLQPAVARHTSLKHVVLVTMPGGGAPPPRPDSLPGHVAVHDFGAAIEGEEPSALASGRVFSPSDTSSWFATGGTTGLPKLAMRTHGNEVANSWSVSQVIGDGIGPGKVLLCGLPMFHVNAVLVTGLVPLSRGAHVVLATPEGYRAPGLVSRFWEVVEHHRVNLFSGVPALYAMLLQTPIGSHDLTTLDYGLCGAAPMPTEVFRAFEGRTGIEILEGYGLTEAACVSSINPPRGERRVGSIGLRVPGQQMKTVLIDQRGTLVRDCAVGEVGTIVVSGPNVFAGYHDRRRTRACGSTAATGGAGSTPGTWGAATRRATSGSPVGRRSSSFVAATTSIRWRSRSRCTATRVWRSRWPSAARTCARESCRSPTSSRDLARWSARPTSSISWPARSASGRPCPAASTS